MAESLSSERPSPYTAAVSKKLIPTSSAASTASAMALTSTSPQSVPPSGSQPKQILESGTPLPIASRLTGRNLEARHSVDSNQSEQCLHQDPQVEHIRTLPDITHPHPILDGLDLVHISQIDITAAEDRVHIREIQRRQVRDTRPDAEDQPFFSSISIGIKQHLGTRADERHVSGQHVEELRQLVKLESAQAAPGPREPGIID